MRSPDWAIVERILVGTLSRSIWSKRTVPHHIVLTDFSCQPLQVWSLATLVLFLRRLHSLTSTREGNQLPLRALASSMDLAAQGCRWCWFTKVTKPLQLFGFCHDWLPIPQGDTHRDPVDTLSLIEDTIYRAYIQHTWITSQQPLTPKMLHYSHHFS